MKSKSQGILLLILVGVAVWPWSCRAQGSDTLSSVEEDVYALVIRSQMEQWIADGDKSIAEAKDAREGYCEATEYSGVFRIRQWARSQ